MPLPGIENLKAASPANFFVRSASDVWRYRWAIETFVTNNLKRRYRRSALGFTWGLLGPLMSMVTLSLVFSVIWHVDIKVFALYIFTGIVPWSFISDSTVDGSLCFIGAESYLKKVFIPKLFFPLVVTGTHTMNFLFCMVSLLFLGTVLGFQWKLSMVLLLPVIAITAVLSLGLTIVFGVATVYYRDLTHILSVTFQALFYTLPILYPLESVPEQFRHWLYMNPFYYVIDLYRYVICKGQAPPAEDWLVSIALAGCVLFAGLFVLKKREHDLIFRM